MDYTTGAVTAAATDNSPTPDPNTPCTLILLTDLSRPDFATAGVFANGDAAAPSKVWAITAGGQAQNIPDDELSFPRTNNNTINVQINFRMGGRTFVDATDMAGPVLNGNGALTNSALRLTMVIGRDKKRTGNAANFGSPFALRNFPSQSCTVFEGVLPASTLNQMSSPSVFTTIGVPALFSNASGRKDSYEILVSITACVSDGASGFVFFTQSHDPEMDISM